MLIESPNHISYVNYPKQFSWVNVLVAKFSSKLGIIQIACINVVDEFIHINLYVSRIYAYKLIRINVVDESICINKIVKVKRIQ